MNGETEHAGEETPCDDLIDRLHRGMTYMPLSGKNKFRWVTQQPTPLELEAADEIKRLRSAVDTLAEAARTFELASHDEIERLLLMVPERPDPVCACDPCPYCTAGEELQIAILDATDPEWRDDD